MKRNLYLLLTAIIFMACSGNDEEKNSAQEEVQKIEVEENIETNTEINAGEISPENDFMLPSIMRVVQMMHRVGLEYYPERTNPIDNIEKYDLEAEKNLNFGVYLADLSYAVMNNKMDKTGDLLININQLGEEIGISQMFDSEKYLQSFQENQEDYSRLLELLGQIHEDIELAFEGNPDLKVQATTNFAGAWTEMVYLGYENFKNKQDKSLINESLVEQMGLLATIIRGLEINPKKSDLEVELLNDFKELEALFKESEVYTEYQETGTAESVKNSDIEKLGSKIVNIRTKIING